MFRHFLSLFGGIQVPGAYVKDVTMKCLDHVQLRESLSEGCTLIHNIVNCLKYSTVLSNAVNTSPECGMLGESALDELKLFAVKGDVGRGLRELILSMKMQLEETKKGVKMQDEQNWGMAVEQKT